MDLLAKNLVWYRKSIGFNQVEMAKQINVSRSQWSDYERGRSEPNLATVMRIASFLKVSLDELFSNRVEDISYENGEVIRKITPETIESAASTPVAPKQETHFPAAVPFSSPGQDQLYETQREVIQTQRALIEALNENIAFLKQRIAELEKTGR